MTHTVSWIEILLEEPFMMFNIFICDMFYFLEEIHYASYADYSVPYSKSKSTGFIANDLEQSSSISLNSLTTLA